MATLNHVTHTLHDAGYRQQRTESGRRLPGFDSLTIDQDTVGVLCGSYPVETISADLIAAGFAVHQNPDSALDAVFVI